MIGKKSYTIVVGKLNTAKLANFMEVDIFVLVGCPENTLVDSTQYYKPIITPYEMELACNTQRYWYNTIHYFLYMGNEVSIGTLTTVAAACTYILSLLWGLKGKATIKSANGRIELL